MQYKHPCNKSSVVAEMGDRGHNRHGPKREGCCALSRRAGNPSGHLATARASDSCLMLDYMVRVINFRIISERELTFTFAICCRPSVCLSVCLSSVVGNARAPYSGGSNFRQYFYGIWYPSHPLTSTENFTEIVPREPLRRGS